MIFSYTALTQQGKRLVDSLEAEDLAAARRALMQQGLFVLEVLPSSKPGKAVAAKPEPRSAASSSGSPIKPARLGELVLFTKQMAMMQQAGASLVPSLHALRDQPGRPAWHALLADLAERVEGGASLHEAMARHPGSFAGPVRSIVAAGEATGTLAAAFARLATLLEARNRVRKRIIGAMAYPCVLLLLAISVLAAMTLFVLPRFAGLFAALNAELPVLTLLLMRASDASRHWWPIVLGAPATAGVLAAFWLHSPTGSRWLGVMLLRTPLFGRVFGSVLITQLLQLWGTLLRSHVPLLDAIRQARDISSNVVFQQLVEEVEDAAREGQAISGVFKRYRFVPAPAIAAIATGEESGRLGESMEFVGNWLEEETNSLIAALTRVLEPTILIGMGVVVGSVCIALFLPLFELATAA